MMEAARGGLGPRGDRSEGQPPGLDGVAGEAQEPAGGRQARGRGAGGGARRWNPGTGWDGPSGLRPERGVLSSSRTAPRVFHTEAPPWPRAATGPPRLC